jgi:hypothetical protein
VKDPVIVAGAVSQISGSSLEFLKRSRSCWRARIETARYS